MRVWIKRLAVAIVITICPGSFGQVNPQYDGNWWLGATQLERVWFVEGYLDTYVYDCKKPIKDLERRYHELITDFYKKNPAQLGIAVGDVIVRLQDLPEAPPRTGGQDCTGPGCATNGDTWAMGYDRAARESYVAGIISCWKRHLPNEGRRYSKSPREYEALVSQWYRLDEATEQVDPKRASESIAAVLKRFRDPVAPQKPCKH